MNQRKIDIQIRNTLFSFQHLFNAQQKVIDIINILVNKFNLSINTQNVKLFYQAEQLDYSKTIEQLRITQTNFLIEVQFTDLIQVFVNNHKLGNYQLKCEVSTTIRQFKSILLKKLGFNTEYSIIFTINDIQLSENKYLFEYSASRNLIYQVFSQNYFIYNKQLFKLDIDVTITLSDLCKLIGDKININSQKIQLHQMIGNNQFYLYHVNPNTEVKFKIIEHQEINENQENHQVTLSIVNDQNKKQFTILINQKVETLINLIKKSFFSHTISEVNFKLFFNDIELQSNNTIRYYNLTNNSVIQLITSTVPQFISFQEKEKQDFKKNYCSVIEEQVFVNKQMQNYQSQLQITQNHAIIKNPTLSGIQIIIKFQHLEQNNVDKFLAQSNELLSKYIYKLIGRKTKDVWISFNNREIDNIEQTFATLQIQNGLFLYLPLQIKLKILFIGELYEIFVNRDKCVIDLFIILRNHFAISDQQEFELEYGNKTVQGIQLVKKLWTAYQEPYKIIILEQGHKTKKNQQIKIYFINKKQYIDYSIDNDQKIEQFQKEFLLMNSYPKNQPVVCFIKNQVDPIIKDIQIKSLNIKELQIEVKDLIMVGTFNNINKEQQYFEVYFNSQISILLDHLKINNCNFYFKKQSIDQNQTFQDIEFYDMDIIEYEIVENTSSKIQIIIIENNQQFEIELDKELSIKDLRQELGISNSFKAEFILDDQQILKDEQKLEQIAKDGQLILNLRYKCPSEQINKQSQILNNESTSVSSKSTEMMMEYQQKSDENLYQFSQISQTSEIVGNKVNNQNKYLLTVQIQDYKHEIKFDKNKKVEDLRQFIIQQYNQKNDIVIRYKDGILNSSDPIPYSNEIIYVCPFVINVKIIIDKRKQTFDIKFKPEQKIGDKITKLVQQIKIKSNSIQLVMGDNVLNLDKTIEELGIKDGEKLNLLI